MPHLVPFRFLAVGVATSQAWKDQLLPSAENEVEFFQIPDF